MDQSNIPGLKHEIPQEVTSTKKEVKLEEDTKINNNNNNNNNNSNNNNKNNTSLGDIVGGSSTRQYLNKQVTPALLRGMRKIAVEKPSDPLRFLGEYLIAESEKQSTSKGN